MRRRFRQFARACPPQPVILDILLTGGPFVARLDWLRDGGRLPLIRNGLRGVEKERLRVAERWPTFASAAPR